MCGMWYESNFSSHMTTRLAHHHRAAVITVQHAALSHMNPHTYRSLFLGSFPLLAALPICMLTASYFNDLYTMF